ncbi:MAG TPA: hypothetical protein VFA43_03600 [Gemmatimonadaceae bacterium]|nr:hypothetical protein [Gemmatimonadaceae bacterium]
MPNWNEVVKEMQTATSFEVGRQKYLRELNALTGRNVIAYYSGWLQKAARGESIAGCIVTDLDQHGFMAALQGLDRTNGLDLILHTPGGDSSATEAIVDYMRVACTSADGWSGASNTNIRAIVP